MKQLYVLALLLFLLAPVFAQSGSLQSSFQRTYGSTATEKAWALAATTDGGFIMCGETNVNPTHAKDLLLIRTASNGDTLWTRRYGGTGDEAGEALAQTTDGGFIVVGYTSSSGQGLKDVYVVKTTADGQTEWIKTIGGTTEDAGYSIAATTDGGYIVCGYTASFDVALGDIYLLKLTAIGDIVWTKSYGKAGFDGGYSVQQTADGGYILTGTYKNNGTENYDVILLKTDAVGTIVWQKLYGGSNDDWGYHVETLPDGYIVSGHTFTFGQGEYDIYLIRTDLNGDTLWTRTYGQEGEDVGWWVRPVADGGFIVAGNAERLGIDHHNTYLLKTDSEGHIVWTRSYGQSDPDPEINSETAVSVALTPDGGYALAGYTTSYGAGGYDFYLLKTDSLGSSPCFEVDLTLIEGNPATQVTISNLTSSMGGTVANASQLYESGCMVTELCEANAIQVPSFTQLGYTLFPNPATTQLRIQTTDVTNNAVLTLTDLNGRTVLTTKVNGSETTVSVAHLPAGVYICALQNGANLVARQMLVVGR